MVRVRVKVRYKCERSDRLNPFHMQAARVKVRFRLRLRLGLGLRLRLRLRLRV